MKLPGIYKMKEYYIDLEQAIDRTSLHDILQETLPLPDYYGRNLDALEDALSEMRASLVFVHCDALTVLDTYGVAFLDTLRRAAAENPGLYIKIEK